MAGTAEREQPADVKVRSIVVGVDGSAASLDALRWAASEASLRGAELHVLLAWDVPYIGPYFPAAVLDDEGWQRTAERTLAQALQTVFGPTVPKGVDAEIRQGPAAPTLLDAAKDADLLIVGSRGHGGLVGLLLGSVSTACIHHAPCPVLVVRPHPSDARD